MLDDMKEEKKDVVRAPAQRGSFASMSDEELRAYSDNARAIQAAAMRSTGDPLINYPKLSEVQAQQARQVPTVVGIAAAAQGTKVYHKIKDATFTLLGAAGNGRYYVLTKEGEKLKFKGENLIVLG